MAEKKRGYEHLIESEDPFVALEIGINNLNRQNQTQQEQAPRQKSKCDDERPPKESIKRPTQV